MSALSLALLIFCSMSVGAMLGVLIMGCLMIAKDNHDA